MFKQRENFTVDLYSGRTLLLRLHSLCSQVQAQVRKAKEAFDKQKLNVLQKVDLLAASRSNMFSHALATYQNSLLSFFKKTSKTMNAVSETFKGFQYYEFTLLKVR